LPLVIMGAGDARRDREQCGNQIGAVASAWVCRRGGL
jgi:hypothetical protein